MKMTRSVGLQINLTTHPSITQQVRFTSFEISSSILLMFFYLCLDGGP